MLIGGIVAVVLVGGIVAAVLFRRRSHDDVHSVEHYHRQLHTLEEMRTHSGPAGRADASAPDAGSEEPAYPSTAFRVTGSPTVRLTDATGPLVPPVPPPPVAKVGEPVKFEDPAAQAAAAAAASSSSVGRDDRALHKIDRRPRRLGAPLAAIGAVVVLVLVLILTGLHSNTPPRHGKAADTATTVRTHTSTGRGHPTTTTTAPPLVSAPQGATANAATYQVGASTYTLLLAATSGECWVEAKNQATGSVIFTGTLFAGQSHSVSAIGAVVTVIAGAPGAFSATVNGSSVSLPSGFQAPFTLMFVPTVV